MNAFLKNVAAQIEPLYTRLLDGLCYLVFQTVQLNYQVSQPVAEWMFHITTRGHTHTGKDHSALHHPTPSARPKRAYLPPPPPARALLLSSLVPLHA